MKNSLNGFLLVDKPAGWTSFDVCAKLRKPLGIKRIGHTGTLDPFATGLLVIAVGKCTKLIPLLEKDVKTYRTKIVLGKTSETLDPESEIVDCHNGNVPSLEDVETLLKTKFTGKITQVPPKYSALKIDGKRAYDLARKGEEVVMKQRATEVKSVKVIGYSFPNLEVELSVAAGFYVRSFASDVGTDLAGGGMCAELRRIGVGDILIKNEELRIKNYPSTPPLAGVSERGASVKVLTETKLKTGVFEIDDFLLDSQALIKNIVHVNIEPQRLPDLQAGRAVMLDALILAQAGIADSSNLSNGERVLVICEGITVGMAEVKDGNLQPRVVF